MNISFKTASSKSIVISKEAQGRALEIIKDLPTLKPKKYQESLTKDIPSKEDFEISLEYQINLATKNMCNQNKNIYDMPSTSKAASIENKRRSIEDIGFKTAAGKMVNISSQAMKNAEKLLSEFCSDDVNDLESMKTEICQKRCRKSNCEPQQDYNENNGKYWDNESDLANVVFSEWPLEDKLQEHSKTSMHLCKDNEFPKSANCQTNLDGFHTAGGKALTISAKSKNAVAKLLRDFQSDSDINTCEEDLYAIKQTILAKHNKLKARNQSNAGGNETKEGKSVQLLPTENDSANLIQNFKTNCDNFENNTFRNAIKCVGNDNNLNAATPTLYNNQQDFQTARGRKILVSAKAEKAVANMLQNLDCCENKAFEEEIMELKNKLQSKHKEQKVTNYSLNEKKNNVVAADHNSLSNISMPKIPSPPAVTLKRTIDTKSVYTPPSKKSFIDAKSSFSDLSSRSPLNSSATKSIISRKNLLSLSKKRKQKSNLSTCNNNENTRQKFELEEESSTSLLDRSETPIKIKASSSLQAPMTPNLNEFFNNATKSSTPRTGVCSKSLHEIDDGFKPIAWNASNTLTTIKPTKLSDDSCSNITLNSTNPTASDRIGRLTMYGEPPAISPIPMETRNCRHPGLRRTRRSMANKSENH